MSSALIGASIFVFCFEGSTTFRWLALRHNKALGTPAYFLLSEPVSAVRARLWARAAEASPGEFGGDVPVIRDTAAQGSPPNIAFILVDTLRADALAAYGGAPELMPETDAFAQKSLVFTNVMANASWTRPSVASMFTGLLPEQHSAVDRTDRLPEDRTTIAEVLHALGYHSAAFVSNFGAVGRDAGFAQGFDDFFELEGTQGVYARAEAVDEAVLGWLDARPAAPSATRTPLFLYIHYLDPHTPYLSGGEDSPFHEVARAAYDSELRYLDHWLRKLIDALETRLPGGTLILVTSDHGEEFGEHGERGHGKALYRESVHVPLVLSVPGGQTGAISTPLEARDIFDLLETAASNPVLDLGAWARDRRRGHRYASLYTTTESALHRPYISHVAMRSMESDGHVLIWSGYGPTTELYDLRTDPDEKRNILREQPDLATALRRDMEDAVPHWARPEPVRQSERATRLLRALGYVK